jgi:multiple sugar transport system permease protein
MSQATSLDRSGAAGAARPAVARRRRGRPGLAARRAAWGLVFVAPAVAFFAVFSLYPTLYAFYLGLTRYDLARPPEFIGLANYLGLARSAYFLDSLRITAAYTFGTAIPIWVISLALALVFTRPMRGKEVLKTLYFSPVVMSGIVVAMIWIILYNPNGLVNAVLQGPLQALLRKGHLFWLTDHDLAIPALVITSVWRSFGYYMIIFLAGLTAIPAEYYEAASIDGANAYHRLRYITVPLLRPTLLFVVVISVIGAFQSFGLQYVMTQGGPNNATMVIALQIYQYAFLFHKMGEAAAMSMVLFVIIMSITLVQVRLLRGGSVA